MGEEYYNNLTQKQHTNSICAILGGGGRKKRKRKSRKRKSRKRKSKKRKSRTRKSGKRK